MQRPGSDRKDCVASFAFCLGPDTILRSIMVELLKDAFGTHDSTTLPPLGKSADPQRGCSPDQQSEKPPRDSQGHARRTIGAGKDVQNALLWKPSPALWFGHACPARSGERQHPGIRSACLNPPPAGSIGWLIRRKPRRAGPLRTTGDPQKSPLPGERLDEPIESLVGSSRAYSRELRLFSLLGARSPTKPPTPASCPTLCVRHCVIKNGPVAAWTIRTFQSLELAN